MNSRDDTPTGISRLDNERNGTHGWTVFVQRRRRVFTKFFADGIHGGKQHAFETACAYRDRLLREYPAFQRREYASILRKNNSSGVPGVCRHQGYWVAFWPTAPGKRKQVKFSIARYGDKAFTLAVAARQRALASLTEPFKRTAKTNSRHRLMAKPAAIPDPRIRRVTILRYRLRVELHDERVITVPLSWFPVLLKASPEERQHWVTTETGDGMRWEKLGFIMTTAQLLRTA
jgi:hypothetical protein